MSPLPTILTWTNGGKMPPPDWVAAHIVGQIAPNGTFLIRSKAGRQDVQARVLVGNVIAERGGVAFTRPANEIGAMLEEIEQLENHAFASLPAKGGDGSGEATQADLTDDTEAITNAIRGSAKLPVMPPARLTGSYPSPLGMPPSIEMRHPSELRIDDSYQRSIDSGPSQTLIERIARGWDWRMCLPLVVSKRDTGFYVIDGQHRHAAALLRGDIPFLPCCVAVYRDVGEEAAMFVAMNRSRRAINRLDDFHAAQAGGDPEAQAIASLIRGAGFTVSRRTGSAAWAPGEVAFTSAIARVRRKHGDKPVVEALRAMAEAFPDERLVAGSSVFSALTSIIITPPPGFDKDRLFRALLQFDMRGWASFLDGARGGSDRAKHLRDMLLTAYEDTSPEPAA